MKIEILSIGDEVLWGNTINTNAAWLSDQLTLQGFEVLRHVTVGDDEPAMTAALTSLLKETEAVIVTGGLGPTVDDFTIEVASRAFDLPLEMSEEVLAGLKKIFKFRGRPMTPNQEKQALIPKGSEILPNPLGTAPGVHLENKGIHFFFLPGVPKEMKALFSESVIPWLVSHRNPPVVYVSKTLRCFGTEEAKLDHLIKPLLEHRVQMGAAKVAFRVSFPEILIKVSSWGESEKKAQTSLNKALKPILELVAPYLYGEGEQNLEQIVAELLLKEKLTLVTAESCTGGQIAQRITSVPGSSQYFLGGVVTYSDTLKKDLLGVEEETLKEYGAVSKEVATQMAKGALQRFKSDLAISVTGIAGPGGGSSKKPVGTVFLALASKKKVQVKELFLPFDREGFRKVVSSSVLNWVRKFLLEG